MTKEQEIIKDLLHVMNMQIGRESEELHIPSHSARYMWDKAFIQGLEYLEENKIKFEDPIYK